MTSNTDREQERSTATGAPGSVESPRDRRAPKIAVGDTSAVQDRKADSTSMKQVRTTFIFLAFLGIAYAAYLVLSGQLDDFVRALIGVNPKWIIAGVACFLCYYVFGVLAYAAIVVVDHDSPVGFRDLMSVEASGVFFMRLTPGGAGVIPSQIYRLTRAGLSLPDASALQFVRFTLYEAGEGIFAAIMLLFCGDYFLTTFADVKILGLDVVWIGIFMFGFKFVQVGGVLLLCLLPGPIQKLGGLGLKLGHALHILNDERYERYLDFLTTQVTSFSKAFRSAASNWHVLPVVELLTLLQLGCMYALPYFVLRSFGLEADLLICLVLRSFGLEADLLICLASGSMVELLVNAIPLPGGAGGAEVGFTYLFGGMFGWHLSAGLVIWRSVEYLLPVVIAAPCMGMRSTTGESIYHRWNRRLENTVHVAHGDWGSVKRRAGIAYRPAASQPVSPDPGVIAAPCMGMRSTTGESLYHRWDRRLETTVHVAHGAWGSVKRRAGIAYRPTASQSASPERKVTRSQTGDLTVKMPKKPRPAESARHNDGKA